jgi:hypothetical protein
VTQRTSADVFSGVPGGQSRTTNDNDKKEGQNSANQGRNVQEAIQFQSYYPACYGLSGYPLFARSDLRLLFGS